MVDIKKRTGREDDFDVKKIISRFIDHWKLFVLALLACLSGGFLFIRYSTPLYKVHAKVLVQDDQQNSNPFSVMGGSSLQSFSSLFGMKSNVYNELGILQTRDLLEKVVEDMNLNISYYRKGRVRSVEVYENRPFNVLFTPNTDSVHSTTFDITFPPQGAHDHFKISSDDVAVPEEGSVGKPLITPIGIITVEKTGAPFENAGYYFTIESTEEVVASLNQNLTSDISNDETTIIDLTYNSNIPRKGEEILDGLISKYIERNLNEKNKISDSTISFIDGRIEIVSKELNDIEATIQGFKQKNKIADISEQAKALITNTSDYYNKLNEVDVQLNVVNSMLKSIQEDDKRPVPSLLNNDPTFLALVEKYNTLLMQRERVLLSTTESNPLVKNVDIQLAGVRNDMIKSLQNQQKALQISKDRIVAENSQLNSMVTNVPVQERKYVDLSRERDVKQALYLFLLQQKEQTSITKASNIPTASIIQTPKAEYKPYFPSKPIVFGISFLLGLILPTGFVVLKYGLSNKINSKNDITEATDCPILAEIGHSDKSELLIMEESGRSVLAEQFRVFRTNLDFIIGQKKCPHILITSTMTGEGKSFVAANIGQVYAYSGKRVLLMEMDLRKPKLSSMLGVSNTIGFTNYMISDEPIHHFIRPLESAKNLYLLSSGPVPPNPAELLMSNKVPEMFEEISTRFDLVIIDSPPIGAVTDAQILNKFSDVNIYIIRQGYSYKNALDIINDIRENNKFSSLYIAVNDVKKGSSYRYGYGSGYGYGYGYGYGDKKQKKLFIVKKRTNSVDERNT